MPFDDNSCDEIIAQDVLEHLTREQLIFTLSEISRVLNINGKLFVRIPNVDAIFDIFVDDLETRNLFCMEILTNGVWGSHKVGLTSKEFKIIALMNSLKIVTESLIDTNCEFLFEKMSSSVRLHKILFINQTLGIGVPRHLILDCSIG